MQKYFFCLHELGPFLQVLSCKLKTARKLVLPLCFPLSILLHTLKNDINVFFSYSKVVSQGRTSYIIIFFPRLKIQYQIMLVHLHYHSYRNYISVLVRTRNSVHIQTAKKFTVWQMQTNSLNDEAIFQCLDFSF